MKKLTKYLMLFFIIFLPSKGYAEALRPDARIDDVKVTLSPNLKVSFQVRDAFTKEIEEAIASGLPTSFTFIVELEKVNSVWFNEDVGRWEFKHTVKYDTLKEEYDISLDETGDIGLRTKDAGEMKRLMVTGNSIAITPAHLAQGEQYDLRVMAELRTVDMPPLLNYMFFFLKLWDFETGWYTYRFSP
ncbi:MAG: DUF4390 domain-containing protein [Deltaproteobacteria bacterium]|nr:DUF4390 domain-containing protein [Deltaproteobacteria bacterium]